MELITSVKQLNKAFIKRLAVECVKKNVAFYLERDGFVTSRINGNGFYIPVSTKDFTYQDQFLVDRANELINALNNSEVTA